MADTIIKKPNIAFLRKVAARQVYRFMSYSKHRGGYYGFHGGQATADKHRKAGYILMAGYADLGRPAYAGLTEKGRAALDEANAKAKEADHG